MPTRIKVIFNRVFVINDADWFGSGEFYFIASVDGVAVGNRKQLFDAVEGNWINLAAAQWSAVVDVTTKSQVVVSLQGKDEDVFWDEDLGSVRHTLRPPWQQRTFRHSTEYFSLEWSVEVEIEGTFGRHAPDAVYACREHDGNLDCTTISGAVIPARLEFHPVRPVPTANLPPRPPLPAGTAEQAVKNEGGTVVTAASDINIIPNPPAIPILASADATNLTAARLEFTYYRPDTLAFTDNDPRLEWSVVPISGGAVSFVGQPRGLKVFVYGKTAGEVRFEVRFRGALFATYRALVLPIKKLPCRFNILNGPNGTSQPRVTPADVQNQLAIANRFLRQMCLELTLDTNATKKDGATDTGTPGIFRISVSKGTTWQVDDAVPDFRATRLNYRPNVMNFAYIHSHKDGYRGAATDFPKSNLAPAAAGARPTITDSGTPSDSWALPSGVLPDAVAGAVTMKLIGGRQRAGHPQLFAMYLTDSIGDPAAAGMDQSYASTIVHEFGHILNLGHRVEGAAPAGVTPANPSGLAANGIYWDGLIHPPNENLLRWSYLPSRQDFDILQTRAARQSPLMPSDLIDI
jgi:hypothetical protein